MKPYLHGLVSARKFGGKPEDYQEIHDFLDSSKAVFPDKRFNLSQTRCVRDDVMIAEDVFLSRLRVEAEGHRAERTHEEVVG